jgi:hypothetical protein
VAQHQGRQLVAVGQGCEYLHVGRVSGFFLGFFLDRQAQLFEQNAAQLLRGIDVEGFAGHVVDLRSRMSS